MIKPEYAYELRKSGEYPGCFGLPLEAFTKIQFSESAWLAGWIIIEPGIRIQKVCTMLL